MTTHPSMYPWHALREVEANDDSAPYYAQGDRIFRIVDMAGTMSAPGFPTLGRAGTLIVRQEAVTVTPAPGVRNAPLSEVAQQRRQP